jgi:signal transduction histidine kinase/ligand-binding sensor domain-containing protein/DNA-binding NarL/FixJ family response regulator
MCVWRTKLWLLPVFLILTNSLFAANYPIRYLGIENGLSNNAVVNIFQDNKGFMWFGTYDGLNRYDGYRFKIYRNKIGDSSSLVDNGIWTIEQDGTHRLWIGGRKGVCVLNPFNDKFSTVTYLPAGAGKAKKLTNNIHVIKSDKANIILVGTENNGLLLFGAGGGTGRQIILQNGAEKITDYEVMGIDFDPGKQFAWVFVQNKGLCRYDVKNKTLTVVNSSILRGNSLKADRHGSVWLATNNGLFRYDQQAGVFSSSYMEDNCKVVNLCADATGALWIGTDGNGVYILHAGDSKATAFTFPDNKHPLSSNAVFSIYEDKDGRKWIGTLRGGVNIIEPRRAPFQLYAFNNSHSHSPTKNFIFSFCEDKDGYFWIGTDGGGLKYWNRETNVTRDYTYDPGNSNGVSSNFITTIIKDSQNDVWFSTWFGGVNRYKKNTGTFEHFVCFNPYTKAEENNAWVVYEDARKTLWASTCNNGTLYTFNRATNRFDIFDRAISNIQCLAEDSKGNMWGGNYSSLIKIDRVNKQHKVYDIGYTIRAIHEDKRGNYWLGTDAGGLLHFDARTGRFTRFSDIDGLPSNSILRILEDNSGNLWLSTYNGLSRFDPVKKTCRNFSQSDGLQSNQFTYNAALKLRSGEMMIGGIKGFNIFYPDSVNEEAGTPPILLTGIKVDNVPVEQDTAYVSGRTMEDVTELRVPYGKASISLDFVALEYTSPDKIGYAYYLEGWDKGWNYVGEARTANYTRLQEGNYVFKIKATSTGGKWGKEIETLKITILPPWYRTWWAYLLYISVVAAAIYFYIQYKTRQERLKYEIKLAHLENEKEKELNERKLSFFTNVSHELRTPLTLIINPLKEFIQKKDEQIRPADLGVVYRNSRRLLGLVDQLLLFRKADAGGDQLKIARTNIVELCNEVYLCFTQQAKAKNIRYQFVNRETEADIYVDYEKIEIALFNLLSNAFKFTPEGGTIIFELEEQATEVLISIRDTGCGIDEQAGARVFEKFKRANGSPERMQTGFGIGLYLVKHFIEGHMGTVSYESRLQEGTSFFIRLKKGTAHLPASSFVADTAPKSAILEELNTESGPLTQDEQKEWIKPEPAAEELVTGKWSILLIDDNPEIRKYLQQLFVEKYVVYEADNGDTGFAMVNKCMPDLVISDVHMDGMDGMELCSRIRKTDHLSHIPVILLTSSSSPDVQIKGIEGGADDYITKPFEKDLLLAKVDHILKTRNLLRQYFLDQITLKSSSIRVPAEYQDFLKRCIAIVEDNLDNDDFSIKAFTQAIGMSHSSLYKKVKAVSGQTISSFIRSIRLRRAAVLMLKENYTINQAAMQVGIGDIKYFREQFVKLFGMNPSDYIKKYRHSFNADYNIIRSDSLK